jgi:hypothetical protein
MIKVYHRKNPTFLLYTEDNLVEHRRAWADGDYKLVAEIYDVPAGNNGSQEEYAFLMTNSIEQAWVGNAGVRPIGGTDHRSTSVGDVVEKSDGTLRICAPTGWKTL